MIHEDQDMTTNHSTESTDRPRGLTPAEMYLLLASKPETKELVDVYRLVVAVAEAVSVEGGRTFETGGAVRDEIMGRVPDDFDLEIHGLTVEQVEKIIGTFGNPEMTGKSFGTYKLFFNGQKVEFSLPRRDSKIGPGHKDYQIDVVPELDVTEAARRREFTIGAIYKDVLTGEIVDPYHGVEDIRNRTLRMVDPKTFPDDALRVLRGMRFAGRFDFTVDPATKQAMSTMLEELGALPKERIREEWLKMFEQSARPSIGLELAKEIGLLKRWHPMLDQMSDTPQDKIYHSEGDVWIHTKFVVDAVRQLATGQGLSSEEIKVVGLAALLHDIGKVTTTQEIDGRIHSHGHESAGLQPSREFLEQIGIPETTIVRILPIIREHGNFGQLLNRHQDNLPVTAGAIRRLANRLLPANIKLMAVVNRADFLGHGHLADLDRPDADVEWLLTEANKLKMDTGKPEPVLRGLDLRHRGWSQGPLVGQAIKIAEQLAEKDYSRDAILTILDEHPDPAEALNQLSAKMVELETV